jgi:hypothetical protein
MSETNGRSRLDRIEELLERHSSFHIEHEMRMARIEALIERQELANEAARERFNEEGQRLLTAQNLMNGAMQNMAEGMRALELKTEETTEKLNALIHTIDGMNGKLQDLAGPLRIFLDRWIMRIHHERDQRQIPPRPH